MIVKRQLELSISWPERIISIWLSSEQCEPEESLTSLAINEIVLFVLDYFNALSLCFLVLEESEVKAVCFFSEF